MSPEEYSNLTGIDVPSRRENIVTAQIERCRAMLEDLLGFTLDPDKVQENLYNELGKTTTELSCPSVDISNLLDPDAVEGAYRVYPFDERLPYLPVDPYVAVYKVKLVHGDITVYTFETDEYSTQAGRDGMSKYIQLHTTRRLSDTCGCGVRWQLAVDADWNWEDSAPADLQYVWADMVTYYANPKREVKSESTGAHSYSQSLTVPQERRENLAVIKRYAGPYGSVTPAGVA